MEEGKRFKELIDSTNRTARNFSEKLEVSQTTIQNILSGRNRAGSIVLMAIAKHMPTVSINYLLTGIESLYIQTNDALNQDRINALTDIIVKEGMEQCLIVTDKEGICIYVDQSFTDITGYTTKDIYGRKPGELLRGNETSSVDKLKIANGLKSKKPFEAKILNYKKDGTPIICNAEYHPIFENGNIVKYISVTHIKEFVS